MDGYNYLHTLMPWGGRGGFSLEPITLILAALDNPQDSYNSVHVAGTNGKGSVSAMIASGLGAAGYKVGLNTSPHLIDLNERIVVDGIPISTQEIDTCALILKAKSEELGLLLSFHEALTVIAFLAFKRANVDYAVIEVGLGGRLDASNVIKCPKVCVVTSIGLDHQDILGNTIEEIASQKAGIIKNSSQVVIGELPPEARAVMVRASEENCASFHEISAKNLPEDIEPPLLGYHQRNNAAVAVKVLEILNVSCSDIRKGLHNTYWPCRLEQLHYQGRELLVDCAHNVPGIENFANYLKFKDVKDAILCFGALNTKDWKPMLDMLIPFSSEWHILEPDSPSAVTSDEIVTYLSCNNIRSMGYRKDYGAFLKNISQLDANKLILLTGSIYLIGKVRSLLDIPIGPVWTKKS